MNSQKVVVFGAGGFGRETAEMIQDHSPHEFVGFLDDDRIKVTISNPIQYDLVVAIANPVHRKEVVSRLEGSSFCNIISSRSNIGLAEFGEGDIICAGVEGTTNISIGNHVIINLNATIGHDVIISDFVSIMPGVNISGNVRIGEATLIGSGATILQGITIGKNCVVGAGAVVTKDLPDNCTAVGVPARIIKKNV